MADQSLSDRNIIITGGGGGIGIAMITSLMARGAKVAAMDISQDNLDRLKDSLAEEGGDVANLLPIVADITQEADCNAAADQARETFGSLNMLINNAGVAYRVIRDNYTDNPIMFWEVSPEAWTTVMNINAFGAHLMARAVVPGMVEQGNGKVINITTGFQNMIRRSATIYGHSKAALEAASSNWARDTEGTGVTVNVLEPGGAADTALVPNDPSIDRSTLVQPEVMKAPICWLASSASDGVSGFRFVGNEWDPDAPADQVAEKIRAPIAWPDIGHAVKSPGLK